MAVLAGVESAVKIHINRGDDLNGRDLSGLTPLMLAASKNKPEICKLLLAAGADDGLTDPSGNTAYAIAVTSNALLAARVLETFPAYLKHPKEFSSSPLASVDLTSDSSLSFDLNSWEPDEVNEPPKADLSVSSASKIIQKAISNHKPIDTSEEWEDFDLYLPEKSLKLISNDDTEARGHLRSLLLRAIREGSIPTNLVEELCFKHGESVDFETKAMMSMIFNDLGAELDERIESVADVFISSDETLIEEDLLQEVLVFMDSLASRQSEPLRLYQKDIQRNKLISSDEEVTLGKTMEIELERAVNALASWQDGIAYVLAAGEAVKNGQKQLSWFSNGPIDEQEEIGAGVIFGETPEVESASINILEESSEEENDSPLLEDNSLSNFLDGIKRLDKLIVASKGHSSNVRQINETLIALGLSRRFLEELAETERGNNSSSAKEYFSSIKAYKKANEMMVKANLKLVFHLAMKYRYSGEPLDDLVQEGNLGLLKAVDRFNWRLGFKFSTYATWWIRQSISRYLCDKGRTIRLPVHVHESANRLNREAANFELKMGRIPTIEELASLLDTSTRKVKLLLDLPPEPVSIDNSDIEELIAIESVSNFTNSDSFEIVFQKELSREMNNFLAVLDSKQQEIIRLRYGLGVEDALTLEEVGKLHGVTRERIRQIEAKAMKKLKLPSRLEVLSTSVLGIEYTRDVDEESPFEEVS